MFITNNNIPLFFEKYPIKNFQRIITSKAEVFESPQFIAKFYPLVQKLKTPRT